MSQKLYSMYSTVKDENGNDHVVTVVGEFVNKKEREVYAENALLTFDDRHQANGTILSSISRKKRRFKMAYSICHPNDTFNEAVGIAIAKSRLKRDPIGEIESSDVTMLNEDMCNMIVFTELQHIKKHIDKYIA